MRAIALVLIACQLTACTSWRLEPLSPAEVVNQQQPDAVRIERADGRRQVWYRPQVQGDSLLGRSDPSVKAPDRRLPLTSIRDVSTSHVSAGKTTALGLGMAALIAAFIALGSIQGPFDNQ